jgi:hypothetical protein
MAISQLIRFLSGANQLARLDTATAFPGEVIAPEQFKYHRILVRAGKIGAFVGMLFGIWVGYELYTHPDRPDQDGGQIVMIFVLAPLMMIVVGILGGVSWAGILMPGTFFSGPVGAHWMKLSGAKSPGSVRLVAATTLFLTIGLLIFFLICAWLGKV